MTEIKVLGSFYQGQGYRQFAVEVQGKVYEGCRRPGDRKTIWTTDISTSPLIEADKERFAGVPDAELAQAIQRTFDAHIADRD